MNLFRRRKDETSVEDEESVEAIEESPDAEPGGVAPAAAAAAGVRAGGPWDLGEVGDPAAGGRVDLGGMWLPQQPGLEVRVEADQQTSAVVAVTLVLEEGALQVQPFAAPRTEGIWDEVRAEIAAGLAQQGGTADEVDGPLGRELRANVPVRAADGSAGVQPARFVGVDGPRWFLRGVLTGRPAVEPDADADLLALFRDIVVVRGDAPMAPREPIPLALPMLELDPEPEDDGSGGRTADELRPFERGPEITEIR